MKHTPSCCAGCTHHNRFVMGVGVKKCSMFGDCARVKRNRCGARSPRASEIQIARWNAENAYNRKRTDGDSEK